MDYNLQNAVKMSTKTLKSVTHNLELIVVDYWGRGGRGRGRGRGRGAFSMPWNQGSSIQDIYRFRFLQSYCCFFTFCKSLLECKVGVLRASHNISDSKPRIC
jgi:hypothetical protein